MTIDKALNGCFHLLNPYTTSEGSLYFDARLLLPKLFLLNSSELSRLIDN